MTSVCQVGEARGNAGSGDCEDRVAELAEMSAAIVHEINQPLSAIMAHAHASRRWLDRPVPDVGRALATITRIVDSADRAARIVQQIRALASGSLPEMAPVDLNEVVDEALALVRGEAVDRRIPLRAVLASGLPRARGNRTQLQQVVVNLVMNGLQATEAAGERAAAVIVRTSRHDAGHLSLAVEDVGVGVAPEKLDRLFSPFYTTKPNGMGMGLSICRAIVDVHGGDLRAARNAGPGMTFGFTLPVAPEAVQAAFENRARTSILRAAATVACPPGGLWCERPAASAGE